VTIWNRIRNFFRKPEALPYKPPRAIAKIGDAMIYGIVRTLWTKESGLTITFTGNCFRLKRPLKDVYKTMGKRIAMNKICSIRAIDQNIEWSTKNKLCACTSYSLSVDARSNFTFSFTLIDGQKKTQSEEASNWA